METVNRIKAKSVGQVRIFEITGNFMGDFARNGNMAIRNALQNRYRRCALFNLSGVKEIDEQGINAILGNSDQLLKSGVLVSNDEIKSRFLDLTNHATNMKVLNDDFDVANYFSHEFAEKTPDKFRWGHPGESLFSHLPPTVLWIGHYAVQGFELF